MTAIEWLIRNVNENIPPMYIPREVVEQAKKMEREQLEKAMMYALDEDGHTGDWKQKFIKKYIDDLSNHPRDNESV